MAVKYGKRGGISYKNTDWRSYYGAENYDRYVAQKKAEYFDAIENYYEDDYYEYEDY